MTYSMMTNMKHLMPADPVADMPAQAQQLKKFLGAVVMAATSSLDPVLLSALPCRKRINRAPYSGLLQIKRRDVPHKSILWHCTACEDGGSITNWTGTHFDLTPRIAPARPTAEDPELEIMVSLQEHTALRSGRIYDPDCERMIYGARVTPKGVQIRGLESDFDHWVGHLAADANHERQAKRRKMVDAVFQKASDALDDSMLRHED